MMTGLIRCLVLLAAIATTSAFSLVGVADHCRQKGNGKSLTLYRYNTDPKDETDIVLGSDKDQPGDINCTVFIKSPQAPAGTTFLFEVTYKPVYSVGVDPQTNQCVAADRGLKIQDNKLTYILGSHPAYWKGGQAVAGSPICGTTPQPANFTRTLSDSGIVMTIKYSGTVPQDKLTVTVKMTCTPGPCPTEPVLPTTIKTTTQTTASSPATKSTGTTARPTSGNPTTAKSSTTSDAPVKKIEQSLMSLCLLIFTAVLLK